MKKIKKFICIFLAVCAMIATFALVACDTNKPDGGKNTHTVTFDTDGGTAIAAQQVEDGGHAVKPDDPTKTNFVFGGWCKDAGGETPFDFEAEVITAPVTIYASWADASDVSTAKFHIGYEGAQNEIFETKQFADGKRIPAPATPARSGFYFVGWFTQDGAQFSEIKKYTGDQDFYGKWQQIFVFEAEKTQLTGLVDDYELGLASESGAKRGHNFSGEAYGTQLIKSDSAASGGAYISGLFYEAAYLQFEITSDKAVNDATLRLVLSVEYVDITLNTDKYEVTVNGTAISFDEFTLGIGATGSTTDPGPRGGFKEIYINKIALNEGKNVIRLTVTNSETPAGDAGTVDAASPAVDCIKIYADAALTMTEY